jgi:hypothetical protein
VGATFQEEARNSIFYKVTFSLQTRWKEANKTDAALPVNT